MPRSSAAATQRGGNTPTAAWTDRGWRPSASVLIAVASCTGVPVSVFASRGGLPLLAGSLAFMLAVIWLTSRHVRLTTAEAAIVLVPTAFYLPFAYRVNVSASDLLLPLMLVSIGRSRAWRLHRSALSTFVYYGLALLTVLCLSLAVASFNPMVPVTPGFASIIKLGVLIVYGVFYLCVCVDGGRAAVVRLLATWRIVGATSAFVAIVAVALYGRGVDVGLTFAYRATGTFEDPNAFATYLIVTLGISMGSTYLTRNRAFTVAVVPIVIAILLTGSRGAVLCLALTLLVALVTAGRGEVAHHFRRAVVVGVGLALLVVMLIPGQWADGSLGRIAELGSPGFDSGGSRLPLWQSALQLWSDNPFLGVGIGQFPYAPTDDGGAHLGALAHNTYASFLAETGILGLLALLWLPATVGVRLVQTPTSVLRIRPYLLFSLVGFTIMAATLNLENFRPFWMFLGICMGVVALAAPRPELDMALGPHISRFGQLTRSSDPGAKK
jgi:O-antigen ligase